jgi:hypothetical protein
MVFLMQRQSCYCGLRYFTNLGPGCFGVNSIFESTRNNKFVDYLLNRNRRGRIPRVYLFSKASRVDARCRAPLHNMEHILLDAILRLSTITKALNS